jgi:hypothetical protein
MSSPKRTALSVAPLPFFRKDVAAVVRLSRLTRVAGPAVQKSMRQTGIVSQAEARSEVLFSRMLGKG